MRKLLSPFSLSLSLSLRKSFVALDHSLAMAMQLNGTAVVHTSSMQEKKNTTYCPFATTMAAMSVSSALLALSSCPKKLEKGFSGREDKSLILRHMLRGNLKKRRRRVCTLLDPRRRRTSTASNAYSSDQRMLDREEKKTCKASEKCATLLATREKHEIGLTFWLARSMVWLFFSQILI